MTEELKPTVTISVDEYNKLKNVAEKFKDADIIVIRSDTFGYDMSREFQVFDIKECVSAIPAKEFLNITSKVIRTLEVVIKNKDEAIKAGKGIEKIMENEIASIQKMSWFDFKIYKHNKKFK